MELIWLDPPRLKQLSADVKNAGGMIIATYYDASDDDRREYGVSEADIKWAEEVATIVDFAYRAGQQNNFSASIKYYKQALLLAPGSDLFFMSIGVAYIQLGESVRGIRFLERAANTSPKNGRIRKNLEAAYQWVRN
jgi:tetratricopeptide (TPR) repeat protein